MRKTGVDEIIEANLVWRARWRDKIIFTGPSDPFKILSLGIRAALSEFDCVEMEMW